jgi:predicted metal-dependent peptidase
MESQCVAEKEIQERMDLIGSVKMKTKRFDCVDMMHRGGQEAQVDMKERVSEKPVRHAMSLGGPGSPIS